MELPSFFLRTVGLHSTQCSQCFLCPYLELSCWVSSTILVRPFTQQTQIGWLLRTLGCAVFCVWNAHLPVVNSFSSFFFGDIFTDPTINRAHLSSLAPFLPRAVLIHSCDRWLTLPKSYMRAGPVFIFCCKSRHCAKLALQQEMFTVLITSLWNK